ncbi:MAG: MFS transporter [Porticoccaceae bacterium]|nr:MAG: MFS transporter [Porticoccaceae bacterium]
MGWYATFVLAFLYWLSILDRFIISLLVEPIQRDLGIDDVQFGLLHGLAFSLTFSLFGLAAGSLADRFPRRVVIWGAVSLWSLATAACGLAQHFWQLLLARVGVGAGEAGLNPAATSMLADLFPPGRLTTAMAVYAMGSTVGSGTAFLVGGLLVEALSDMEGLQLPLLGAVRAWQLVFLAIGLPGLAAALLIFTLPEPLRRSRGELATPGGYRVLLSFMARHWRFYLPVYLGFGLASMLISGGGVWYPAHMARHYGWSSAQIGLFLGTTLMGVGVAGKLLAGWFVDFLHRRGHRDAQLLWYGCCCLVAGPLALVTMASHHPWLFTAGVGAFMILLSPMAACCYAALNLVTPNELRGVGVALFSATAGIAAVSAGPVLIAWVGNAFFPGSGALGMGLAAVFAAACPLAGILLLAARRPMRALAAAGS